MLLFCSLGTTHAQPTVRRQSGLGLRQRQPSTHCRPHWRRLRTACSAAPPPQQPAAEAGALPSLIPDSLDELDSDEDLKRLHERVQKVGQAALTREEAARRRRSLEAIAAPNFSEKLAASGCSPLRRKPTTVFQLNVGLFCNQACKHCHVESSPRRTEAMSREVAERCVELLEGCSSVTTLDITGGAPEYNPNFRYLVSEGRRLGVDVMDRCNLTVLLEPGHEDTAQFLSDNGVHIVASLPCYSASSVDAQRGPGVFERSILGLQRLNALGYGREGSGLQLDLVYNPGGVFLAPAQAKLEATYKQELRDGYGIEFNRLFCLNNMPIKRWADFLVREGKLEEYMSLLVNSFNPAAAEGVMCRDTVSVRWDGRLYDCDFNNQLDLGMPTASSPQQPFSVFDISSLDELVGRRIAVDSHCYGCTAGAGSSCQGATS